MSNKQLFEYDTSFYDSIESGTVHSARAVLGALAREIQPASVLDFGCGRGAWLREWMKLGVSEVMGLDGPYVKPESLLIPEKSFRPTDLSHEVDIGRTFDLVMSLEVAEHIAAEFADRFIGNMVRHGKLILFSAAVPGQGGMNHVNEQSLEYWRAKFIHHGYQAYDFIRPFVAGISQVEPWYRYNTLCYAHESVSLPEAVRHSRIAPGHPIVDLSPLPYRARKSLVRLLPISLATKISALKRRG